MSELIRIEVPEPITIKAQRPDGAVDNIPFSFEQYVLHLINKGAKRFNSDGKGIRKSISIANALEEMKKAAKEREEEGSAENPPLLIFIVDEGDWKDLVDESEAPENGYPFTEFGLAARNFVPFMDALRDAKENMKVREKLLEEAKKKALPSAEEKEVEE